MKAEALSAGAEEQWLAGPTWATASPLATAPPAAALPTTAASAPIAGGEGEDLLASEATLLRLEPAALEPLPKHLARLAAALAPGGGHGGTVETEGHTGLKGTATDSRPHAGQDFRPTDVKSPGRGYAGRVGGRLIAFHQRKQQQHPLLGEGKTQLNHYRRGN